MFSANASKKKRFNFALFLKEFCNFFKYYYKSIMASMSLKFGRSAKMCRGFDFRYMSTLFCAVFASMLSSHPDPSQADVFITLTDGQF